MRCCILLLCFVLPAAVMSGQDYSLHNFTVKDGLPSQEVYCALQDHKGQMWFGSDAGVSVYNGFHFTNYSTRDGLLDNSVFAMCQDSMNRIWFGTLNRKVFYYSGNRFTPALTAKGDTITIPTGHILRLFVIGDAVYMNTSYCTYFLKPENNVFRLDSMKGAGPGNSVTLQRVGAGMYACYHQRGGFKKDMFSIALKRGNKTQVYSVPNRNQTVFPMFWTARELHDTVIYTIGKAVYMLRPDGTADFYDQPKDVFYSDIRQGRFVVRSEELGMRFFKLPELLKPEKIRFPNYTITSAFNDHEGGYWFTTLESGVFYSTSFGRVRTPAGAVNNINIRSIRSADSTLFVANKSGTITAYRAGPEGELYEQYIFQAGDDNVLFDFETDGRYLYTATRNGMFIYTHENRQFRQTGFFGAKHMRDISLPDKQTFYAISRNAIFVLKGDKVAEMLEDLTLPEAFQVFASNDTIYMGGTNGLFRLDGKTTHKIEIPGVNKLEHIHIIIRDKKGRFCLGTEESGLVLVDHNRSLVAGTDAGLISNNVTGLVFSDDSTLWVSTKRGLSKVILKQDLAISHIENFDLTNGLINDNINCLAYFQGILCFGTQSGFFAIHENDLKQNRTRPQIFIDRIENLKAEQKSGHFGYDENDFRLHISVSSFRNAGNIPVKYKLRKEDTTFYYQNISNGTLTLLQLEPGDYEVSIYAANNNGVWSEKAATYSFSIAKPFWRQTYFWLLLSVVLLLAVLLVARLRVRQITRREKEKAEFEIQIENLKNQALRLQMNPHFLFNALNAIQGFYANENKTLAKNYIYNLSRLLRLILESSKQDEILLENEIEIVRAYLDLTVLRFEDKLDYSIHVAEGVPLNRLNVPPMILQPFIENAFIHGIAPKEGKGHIDIAFRIENEQLLCTITDNGIGRKASAAMKLVSVQRSSGINITRERIALLNKKHDSTSTVEIQDLTGDDGKAAGTRVILKLSLKMDDHA